MHRVVGAASRGPGRAKDHYMIIRRTLPWVSSHGRAFEYLVNGVCKCSHLFEESVGVSAAELGVRRRCGRGTHVDRPYELKWRFERIIVMEKMKFMCLGERLCLRSSRDTS